MKRIKLIGILLIMVTLLSGCNNYTKEVEPEFYFRGDDLLHEPLSVLGEVPYEITVKLAVDIATAVLKSTMGEDYLDSRELFVYDHKPVYENEKEDGEYYVVLSMKKGELGRVAGGSLSVCISKENGAILRIYPGE